MSQQQSGPPREFVETIREWHQFNGDEDIRAVIIRLASVIRKRQSFTDNVSPIVASLRAAGAPSTTPETRAVVLWNVIPHLKASDQMHRTVSSERIWNLLMSHAEARGYLQASEIARYKNQRLVLPGSAPPTSTYRSRSDGLISRFLNWLGGFFRGGSGDDFLT